MMAVVFWTFLLTKERSVSSRISPVSFGVRASRFTFGFLNGFFTGAFGPPPSIVLSSFSSSVLWASSTNSRLKSPPFLALGFSLKFSYLSSSSSESSIWSFIPLGATALGTSPSSNISIYSTSTS